MDRVKGPAGVENSPSDRSRLPEGIQRSGMGKTIRHEDWLSFHGQVFPKGDKGPIPPFNGYAASDPWCRC